MMRLGVETLVRERRDLLDGKRLGLVTNPSGVRSDLTATVEVLYDDEWDLRRLFAPEHGIRGSVQSGTGVNDAVDERTGLRVESLRNVARSELEELFDGLDAVLYDIQDNGCRFYTHLATLLHALEGTAMAGTELVVLDRPNPVAPMGVNGNVAAPMGDGTASAYELPVTPGLTVGELAHYCNEEYDVGADLEVVTMEGWTRSTWFDETGLPWVQPSPNMPTVTTAILYPGTCFFEGTNLSEGRGTTKPFELVGAPWIDAADWAGHLNELDLPGVGFRPAYFTPMYSKHERKDIEGVQVHVLDRNAVEPVAVGLTMIVSAFTTYDEAEWLRFDDGVFVDRLVGNDALRKAVDSSKSDVDSRDVANSVMEYWTDERDRFSERAEAYMLY